MSVHARLAALQAENASLSEAADEAANLAETLALDNSKLRTQLSNVSDTLVRKDRQINTLSSQIHKSELTIATLNRQVDDLKSQLEELRQLASIADEIEVVLRHTVQTLQKRLVSAESVPSADLRPLQNAHPSIGPALGASFPNATLIAAFRTHTDILSLSSESPSTTAVHLALANASAIVSLASSALSTQSSRSPSGDPLSNPLATATVVGNVAATYLLSDPALAVQRTKQLDEALTILRDRVSDVAQSRSSRDATSSPASDSSVTFELLQMAVSAVSNILPNSIAKESLGSKAPFAPNGGLTAEAFVALKHIDQMNSGIATEHGVVGAITSPDPQLSRLKQALGRRERELDDLRVRHTAFEKSVRVAVAEAAKASADADALRARLVAVEAVPGLTIDSPSEIPPQLALNRFSDESLQGLTSASHTGIPSKPERGIPPLCAPTVSMSKGTTPVDGELMRTTRRCTQASGRTSMTGPMVRVAQEQLRRLRATYSISTADCLLCDYPETTHSTGDPDPTSTDRKTICQKEAMNRFYRTLQTAQLGARKAAACARVAQIDKKTLAPASRGATLSLRRSLEAIACSRRMNLHFSRPESNTKRMRQKIADNIVLDGAIPSDIVNEFARAPGLQARLR